MEFSGKRIIPALCLLAFLAACKKFDRKPGMTSSEVSNGPNNPVQEIAPVDSTRGLHSVAEYNGELYVAGNLNNSNTQIVGKLVDGKIIPILTGLVSSGSKVLLCTFQNRLFIAGDFTSSYGNDLLYYDGAYFSDFDTQSGTDKVYSLKVLGDSLYVAGNMTTNAGWSSNYLVTVRDLQMFPHGCSYTLAGIEQDNNTLYAITTSGWAVKEISPGYWTSIGTYLNLTDITRSDNEVLFVSRDGTLYNPSGSYTSESSLSFGTVSSGTSPLYARNINDTVYFYGLEIYWLSTYNNFGYITPSHDYRFPISMHARVNDITTYNGKKYLATLSGLYSY